jgi:hypothetical protein
MRLLKTVAIAIDVTDEKLNYIVAVNFQNGDRRLFAKYATTRQSSV